MSAPSKSMTYLMSKEDLRHAREIRREARIAEEKQKRKDARRNASKAMAIIFHGNHQSIFREKFFPNLLSPRASYLRNKLRLTPEAADDYSKPVVPKRDVAVQTAMQFVQEEYREYENKLTELNKRYQRNKFMAAANHQLIGKLEAEAMQLHKYLDDCMLREYKMFEPPTLKDQFFDLQDFAKLRFEYATLLREQQLDAINSDRCECGNVVHSNVLDVTSEEPDRFSSSEDEYNVRDAKNYGL